MQKLIWTNSNGDSIDLTSGNYGITNWEGFSNTSLNIQSQQVPFHDGSVFLDALLEQRELSVTLAIQDKGNLETRYRLRRELIHILNPKSGEGYLIYKNDFTQKRIKCISQIPLFENHNSNDSGTPKATLSWTACESYWEDLEPIIVPLYPGQRFTVENVGDVKTGFEVEFINDNAVNPKIINYTQNKSVELKGTFNKNILIDSNFGKKRIYEKEIVKTDIKGKLIINDIKRFSQFGCFIGVGEDIYVSNDGVKFEIIKNPSTKTLYTITYDLQSQKIIIGGDEVIITSKDAMNFIIQEENNDIVYYGSAITSDNKVMLAGQKKSTENAIITIDYSTVFLSENTGTKINSILENNGKIIAVGSYNGAGLIVTSDDRTVWTTTSQTEELLCIAQHLNLIVISGKNGLILYGNGSVWNVATVGDIYGNPSTSDITKVNWYKNSISENGNFYAIDSNGGILLGATDGTDFKTYNSPIYETESLIAFCCSVELNLFVYCGDEGTILNSGWFVNQSYIVSWNGDLYDVAYGKGKYIAVGDGAILSSPDCEDWTLKLSIQYKLNRVIYNDSLGLFVAVGEAIYVSSDGDTWTLKEVIHGELVSIAFHDSIMVAVGFWVSGSYNYDLIARSTNGNSWHIQNGYYVGFSGFTDVDYYSEDEKFYISGGDVGKLLSGNGKNNNWNSINILINAEASNKMINKINCFDKIYIENEDGMYVSSNGINFTLNALINYDKLFYDENLEVYVAFSTTDYLFNISLDLIHWVEQQTETGIQSIVSVDNKTIGVGLESKIIELISELKANIISSLSTDSDMALGLEIGTNEILISNTSGNMIAKIKYTPKYIGV